MLRRLVVFVVIALTAVASQAGADDVLDVDECADPTAGCLPEQPDPDDASLDATEATETGDDPVDWAAAPAAVACPEGATATDGRCVPDPIANASTPGGCTAGDGARGIAIVLVIGFVVVARRRRLVLALAAAAACTVDAAGWDDLVDAGPPGDASHVEVFAAELQDGHGSAFVLANQTLPTGVTVTPTAQFSLDRATGERAVLRVRSTGCGDRLVSAEAPDAELLGWAQSAPGNGTAELVELVRDCAYVYETHAEQIAALVADGYAVVGSLGYVWPPGWSDTVGPEDDVEDTAVAKAPCAITARSPAILLYASPGKVETLRFLKGCPGEVIVGEKGETGPHGSMATPEAHAAGGRTAFVIDRHGEKLRDLLLRSNGVERTAAYLRHKLSLGYDYLVIDEITTAADWRDGSTANRRLRAVMLRLPARKLIPYISIDLTQYAGGLEAMRARRFLLRAFKRRGRTIAMEVYLHTAPVMAGAAPAAFRRAADRLALAVAGMTDGGGINLRATTTIGTSMHSTYPQYRYLDQPSHDLAAITRQVNALRHGGKRVRQQRGIGFYFVNKSDMAPPSAYSYDALIGRMRTQALRFR